MEMNVQCTQSYETWWKHCEKRKFMALSDLIQRLERLHTNNLKAHLKPLDEKNQTNQEKETAGNNRTQIWNQ